MKQRADHVLLDHADRDSQTLGDLGVRIAFELVHDEGLAAGPRQFVEIHGEPGKLVAVLIGGERAVGEVGIRQSIEINPARPFPLAAQGKIDRCVACGGKEISLGMLNGSRIVSSGYPQPGILHDLFTAISIADETRGEPDRITIVPPEEVGEPDIECTHRHFVKGAPSLCAPFVARALSAHRIKLSEENQVYSVGTLKSHLGDEFLP